MSKREKELFKKAYLKVIRDITAFIGITGLFTTMFVIAMMK